MESPIGTVLKLVGAGFLIYYFGLNNWLLQQYLKWRTAVPQQAQQFEQKAKPLTQTIEQFQQAPSPTSPTPLPSSSPQPKQKYGMNFKIETPAGSINSGFQIDPRTNKDLGGNE